MGRYKVETESGRKIGEYSSKNVAKEVAERSVRKRKEDVFVMDQHSRDRIIHEAFNDTPDWLDYEPENPS